MPSLSATVISIEGDVVTLSLEDGQTLKLPVTVVSGKPAVGLTVRVFAAVLGSEDAGEQALARELLNEILRS